MYYLEIEGNAKLGGEVAISGAKNAALPLIRGSNHKKQRDAKKYAKRRGYKNIGYSAGKFGRKVRICGRSHAKNQLKLR